MWSKTVHWVHWLWGPPGCAKSVTTYAMVGATQYELQSNMQMTAILLGLEVPRRGQAVNKGWLPLRLGLGPLARGRGYVEAR